MVRKRLCTEGTRDYFEEYCNNTSLHGLKYVGEHRTSIEKFLWSLLFVSAVCTCTYMIYETYRKWDSSPVIVSFAQNPTPIGAIPFPAVTICPENKAKQTAFNYTKLLMDFLASNTTDENEQSLYKLFMVCDYLRTSKSAIYSRELEMYMNLFEEDADANLPFGNNQTKALENDDLISFFIKAAPNASEIFSSCRWNTKKYNCAHLFVPTLNEDGICYTFNMLGDPDLLTEKAHKYQEFINNTTKRSDWNTEQGFRENHITDSYPRRVVGSGLKYGLEIELKADEYDFDYMCKSTVQGFKVVLHEPGDIAKGRTQYIRVPIDQEVTIAIQPNMITTSDTLLGYSPDKRNCFFLNERKLEFFKQYTQESCNLECLSEVTLRKCGCAAFYMPRTNETKLCGPMSHECVMDVEAKFLSKGVNNKNELSPPCDCKPACHSIQYDAETSQASFEWKKFVHTVDLVMKHMQKNISEEIIFEVENKTGINMSELLSRPDERHFTQLKIFFKDTQFISTSRSELYGITDFISNCGGIFGLFTGFSILSLMEILYYLTLRVFVNKKIFGNFFIKTPDHVHKKKKNKRDEKEKENKLP